MNEIILKLDCDSEVKEAVILKANINFHPNHVYLVPKLYLTLLNSCSVLCYTMCLLSPDTKRELPPL